MRVVTRDRDGVAIVFVLLLMLALFALAHGMLVSALAEQSTSAAARRELEARMAATAALGRAFTSPGGAWMDSVSLWDEITLAAEPHDRGTAETVLRRLGTEAWLIEGSGSVGARARSRAGRLVWSLDPVERISALGGAVTVPDSATVLGAGAIDAGNPLAARSPALPADCAAWVDDLAPRYGSAPLTPVASRADSLPLRLGVVPFDSLVVAFPVRVSGSGTPEPVERLGACAMQEPWSWGDPDRPWRPCGGALPARVSLGDLEILGGVGQGLLVVDGDLTMRDGARFYGLLIVRGSLRLREGAMLDGMAIAAGDLEVAAGSSVRASACRAVAALDAHRAELGRLRPVTGAHWIGPL